MGNTSKSPQEYEVVRSFVRPDWVNLEQKPGYEVWQNTRHNTRADVYPLHEAITPEDYTSYEMRHNSSEDIVGVHHVHIDQESALCSKASQAHVYVERIPYRLSDVSTLTSAQALTTLRAAYRGFDRLSQYYGPVEPYEDMVCFNEQRRPKVWVNSNLALNHPENSVDRRHVGSNQEAYVNKIFDMVDRRASPPLDQKLKNRFRNKRPGDYEHALKLVEEYCIDNRINIHDTLGSHREISTGFGEATHQEQQHIQASSTRNFKGLLQTQPQQRTPRQFLNPVHNPQPPLIAPRFPPQSQVVTLRPQSPLPLGPPLVAGFVDRNRVNSFFAPSARSVHPTHSRVISQPIGPTVTSQQPMNIYKPVSPNATYQPRVTFGHMPGQYVNQTVNTARVMASPPRQGNVRPGPPIQHANYVQVVRNPMSTPRSNVQARNDVTKVIVPNQQPQAPNNEQKTQPTIIQSKKVEKEEIRQNLQAKLTEEVKKQQINHIENNRKLEQLLKEVQDDNQEQQSELIDHLYSKNKHQVLQSSPNSSLQSQDSPQDIIERKIDLLRAQQQVPARKQSSALESESEGVKQQPNNDLPSPVFVNASVEENSHFPFAAISQGMSKIMRADTTELILQVESDIRPDEPQAEPRPEPTLQAQANNNQSASNGYIYQYQLRNNTSSSGNEPRIPDNARYDDIQAYIRNKYNIKQSEQVHQLSEPRERSQVQPYDPLSRPITASSHDEVLFSFKPPSSSLNYSYMRVQSYYNNNKQISNEVDRRQEQPRREPINQLKPVEEDDMLDVRYLEKSLDKKYKPGRSDSREPKKEQQEDNFIDIKRMEENLIKFQESRVGTGSPLNLASSEENRENRTSQVVKFSQATIYDKISKYKEDIANEEQIKAYKHTPAQQEHRKPARHSKVSKELSNIESKFDKYVNNKMGKYSSKPTSRQDMTESKSNDGRVATGKFGFAGGADSKNSKKAEGNNYYRVVHNQEERSFATSEVRAHKGLSYEDLRQFLWN